MAMRFTETKILFTFELQTSVCANNDSLLEVVDIQGNVVSFMMCVCRRVAYLVKSFFFLNIWLLIGFVVILQR